jgi:hypothetical protein
MAVHSKESSDVGVSNRDVLSMLVQGLPPTRCNFRRERLSLTTAFLTK